MRNWAIQWNRLQKIIWGLLVVSAFGPGSARGGGQTVVINGGATPHMALQGRSVVPLTLQVGCYAANIRQVANPLAPSSMVTLNMTIAGYSTPLQVTFPAAMTFGKEINKASCVYQPAQPPTITNAHGQTVANPNYKPTVLPSSGSLFNISCNNHPVGHTLHQCFGGSQGQVGGYEYVCKSPEDPTVQHDCIYDQTITASTSAANGGLAPGVYFQCTHVVPLSLTDLAGMVTVSGPSGTSLPANGAFGNEIQVNFPMFFTSAAQIQSWNFTQRLMTSAEQQQFVNIGTELVPSQTPGPSASPAATTGPGPFVTQGDESTTNQSYLNDMLAYSGKTGVITSPRLVSATVSAKDGGTLLFSVLLPGQDGFCGSYHSPLMVFFDDVLPRFTGVSSFPLDPKGQKIYWVEPGAPGYFLALDMKGDKKITSADQLFGNSDHYRNGFEALKRFDGEGRGVIDAKNPIFQKLVLWQDRNGDGISQPDEVKTLKEMGITSISLKYKDDDNIPIENRAAVHGSGTFQFKVKGKKGLKTGKMLDIWFSPAQ